MKKVTILLRHKNDENHLIEKFEIKEDVVDAIKSYGVMDEDNKKIFDYFISKL